MKWAVGLVLFATVALSACSKPAYKSCTELQSQWNAAVKSITLTIDPNTGQAVDAGGDMQGSSDLFDQAQAQGCDWVNH